MSRDSIWLFALAATAVAASAVGYGVGKYSTAPNGGLPSTTAHDESRAVSVPPPVNEIEPRASASTTPEPDPIQAKLDDLSCGELLNDREIAAHVVEMLAANLCEIALLGPTYDGDDQTITITDVVTLEATKTPIMKSCKGTLTYDIHVRIPDINKRGQTSPLHVGARIEEFHYQIGYYDNGNAYFKKEPGCIPSQLIDQNEP